MHPGRMIAAKSYAVNCRSESFTGVSSHGSEEMTIETRIDDGAGVTDRANEDGSLGARFFGRVEGTQVPAFLWHA